MATLAYPVSQSNATKLFDPKLGTGFGNSKPTGKSTNTTITNINWQVVLDKNKLNGNSVIPTTFLKLQIPLDTKKLSSMEVSNTWTQANTARLGASKWYANNISFNQSFSNNQTVSIKTSKWVSSTLSFDNSSIAKMQSGNVYAGSLITPYLYDSLTTGSMILVKNTTIGISNNTTATIYSYNEKMLTIKTGCVSAYGELQRNNGWSI